MRVVRVILVDGESAPDELNKETLEIVNKHIRLMNLEIKKLHSSDSDSTA